MTSSSEGFERIGHPGRIEALLTILSGPGGAALSLEHRDSDPLPVVLETFQAGQPLLLEGRRREPGAPFKWQVQVDYAAPATQGNNKNKRATGLKLMEIDDHQVSVSQ